MSGNPYFYCLGDDVNYPESNKVELTDYIHYL